jgi:hypothetical protein
MSKRDLLLFYFPSVAFRRAAKSVLVRELGTAQATRIWAETPGRMRALRKTRPKHSLGVNFLVLYMEKDVALFQSALAEGLSTKEAGELVRKINWKIFEPMTAISFKLSRLRSAHLLRRVSWLMDVMFSVLFTSPFQRVVQPSNDAVAFDVTACPLADYFNSLGVPELTRYAACNLDHDMAMQWGLELKRTKTIADGAPLCDFRFQRIGADAVEQDMTGEGFVDSKQRSR